MTSSSASLLISNGIGDWIVYDSLLTSQRLSQVKTVYWANRGQDDLIPICQQLPGWRTAEHRPVWTDWSRLRGFADPAHLRNHAASHDVSLPPELETAEEWWPGMWRGHRDWQPSRLLGTELADVAGLLADLPESFVVVQTDSPHNGEVYRQRRRLAPKEIYALDARLAALDAWGVLVDLPGLRLPPGVTRLIDRRGQLSLAEGWELLKRSGGYIGIDSCFSVLAAQVFADRPDRLLVRSRNLSLVRDWWRDYYRPHRGPGRDAPKWLVWSIDPHAFTRSGSFAGATL